MNIRIISNFQFSVTEISYAPNGELAILRPNDNMLKKMAIIVCWIALIIGKSW